MIKQKSLRRLHWSAATTRHLMLALTALFLFGCTGVNNQPQSPTAGTISQQEAIERALKAASNPQPEITGALVRPENIRAELMTLSEAIKRLGQADLGPDERAGLPVWFVTMDGFWGDAFPRPTEFPTPRPFRRYIVVVDANSGGVKRVAALY